jgi:hypothetical protein
MAGHLGGYHAGYQNFRETCKKCESVKLVEMDKWTSVGHGRDEPIRNRHSDG